MQAQQQHQQQQQDREGQQQQVHALSSSRSPGPPSARAHAGGPAAITAAACQAEARLLEGAVEQVRGKAQNLPLDALHASRRNRPCPFNVNTC